jgi:hypothetical protein
MTTNPKIRVAIFAASILCILAGLALGPGGFFLATPLVLLLLCFVPGARPAAMGILIGWFVMLYDDDFGLNLGGPEAPIQRGIRNLLGLRWDDYVTPVLLLMLGGGCAGILCKLIAQAAGRAKPKPQGE